MFYDEAEWRSALFCLIAPDAVRRHLASDVLTALRDEGLRPTHWRPVQLSGAQVDAMTELNITASGQAYRYRCLDALFALGPSIAVRLRSETEVEPASLYGRLAVRKGAADPWRAEPGTIRRDLGAINTILSLLHISDSPADSARESALVLGRDETADGWQDADGLAEYLHVLENGGPAEERALADVRAALRAQLVGRLWDHLAPAGRLLAAEFASRGRLGLPDAGWQLAKHLADGAPVDPRLVGLLRATFEPGDAVDMTRATATLGAAGVVLDPWASLVLMTSTYFPSREPDRVAAEVGGVL